MLNEKENNVLNEIQKKCIQFNADYMVQTYNNVDFKTQLNNIINLKNKGIKYKKDYIISAAKFTKKQTIMSKDIIEW